MCGIWGFVSSQEISQEQLAACFNHSILVKPRGPERSHFVSSPYYALHFHRLAINGIEETHDQPYVYSVGEQDEDEEGKKEQGDSVIVMCNGEIYNYRQLLEIFLPSYTTNVKCDTEALYPVSTQFSNFAHFVMQLRGEFALVFLHVRNNRIIKVQFACDPCSVRPLYIALDKQHKNFIFSSTLAGLSDLDNTFEIQRCQGGVCYTYEVESGRMTTEKYFTFANMFSFNQQVEAKQTLYSMLHSGVCRRMMSDRPVGAFLSGGLDSSVVCAILARELKHENKQLHTFSIGFKHSPDIKYAQMVAEHIGSIHTVVELDVEEAINSIPTIIKVCETYDLTTIRASIGQYLVSKYIRENTDIKVVLSGDGSDEQACGYLYFYNAPSAAEAHQESVRLLERIHQYDGLRVDRCVSAQGLEARLPYLDQDVLEAYLQIPGEWKQPIRGSRDTRDTRGAQQARIEKWLLRSAIEELDPTLLPAEVLWRVKETFSDNISVISESESLYTKIKQRAVDLGYPSEREWYRAVFDELFKNKSSAETIPGLWMPKWVECAGDPSAKSMNVYAQVHSAASFK
jgi:asparagine synthase (glutamine-hydrolysing)